jgi:phenylacetate-CoA ligase
MNPFINPVTGIPFLKHIFLDPKRLIKMSPKQLENYRNKALRKIVKYAYTVPVYHQKYRAAGIYPGDIKSAKDIIKLPFITKKDLVDNYPDGIIPNNFDKSKAVVISTSGSTGKPVSVFFDFYVYSEGIGAIIRTSVVHKYNWRKVKYANVGNFSPGKADEAASRIFYNSGKFAYSSKKYGTFSAFEPIKKVMKKLDEFKPDVMLSYPITYLNLAILKNKGFGKNVNPKILLVSGYVLDDYTRSYVEDAFNCKMYNGYGGAETSSESPIAFECPQKKWHINQDYFHVETIDDSMKLIDTEKIGHIVVTRLFGKGTPIIRYTGLDDWVKLTDYYECGCGICTPTFKDGVEGRRNTSIILPDGRIFPSASFAIISVVLNKMQTRKVKQFQIIQNKLDDIEILIVIDEDLKDANPSIDILFKKIKEIYEDKVGPGITITIKEAAEKDIKSESNKPAPLVISHISHKEWENIIEKSK